jgi:plasmid stability protein
MVQIRNMPDDVHRALKARAAKAGMTLSDFLLQEATELARRPALDEVLDRIARRPPVKVRPDPAAAVRAERGSRR